jgi:hypothetical protein
MKRLVVLVMFVLTARPACQGSVGPNEPDEPPGEPPRGKPDATILENIAFLRAQEVAARPNSILVALGGISPIGGTTCPDGYWWYRFAEPPYYRLHDWAIGCDGRFSFWGEYPDTFRLDIAEIGNVLTVDSRDVIRIARENGGQAYLDRYPDARVELLGRFRGGRPAWEIHLESRQTRCGLAPSLTVRRPSFSAPASPARS